jgi:thiol-disulfide isomerase/thioredoxin
MKRFVAPLVFVALVVGALVLTRGGGTGDKPEAAPPALTVTRIDGSGEVALAQAASAEMPTLLWFFAPWCPVCDGEAPKIQQLAEQARGKLEVVAIGGRDELANAPEFAARHGLATPTMLFDESMQVWEHYRIPGQPAAVLLDRTGRERQRWLGPFDPNLALEAAETL